MNGITFGLLVVAAVPLTWLTIFWVYDQVTSRKKPR